MKRIYACIAILAVILGLAVWGGFAVRGFEYHMKTSLADISQQMTQEDAKTAASSAEACLQSFRAQEHILSVFLRRDYLSALDVTLCAIRQYAEENNTEEALAEVSRAESQVYGMCHLFLRLL